MTDYPGAIYSPRAKENSQDVSYDPEKKTVIFAEDITKLDDEVIAVETELGTNPKGTHDSVADYLGDLSTDLTNLSARVIFEGRPWYISGTFYSIPGVTISSVSTSSIDANYVYYNPICVTSTIVLTQLAVEVTTAAAAGSKARLGIYNSSISWQPSTLVLDAGEIATDSTGIKYISINKTLSPGRYLFAITASAGFSARTFRGGFLYTQLLPNLGSYCFPDYFRKSRAYSAFPSPADLWNSVATSASPFRYFVVCKFNFPA